MKLTRHIPTRLVHTRRKLTLHSRCTRESVPAMSQIEFWDYHNVQYLMKDGRIAEGELYPDEVPCSYTDDEGNDVEDYTKEWVFVDDNTDPVYSNEVKAWRYQKE